MFRNLCVAFTVFAFSLSSVAAGGHYYYVIKANEDVSSVLYRAGIEPIYGKRNSLAMVQKLNADHIPNINKVHIGDKIYLSKDLASRSQNLVLNSEKGQYEFIDSESSAESVATDKPSLPSETISSSEAARTPAAAPSSEALAPRTGPASGTAAPAALTVKTSAPITASPGSTSTTTSPAVTTSAAATAPASSPSTVEPTQAPTSVPMAAQKQEPVGLSVYAGVGVNYVQYNEDLSDLSSKYRDFRGPSTNLGVNMTMTENVGLEAGYRSTPMRFDNSSVTLVDLSGKWDTFALQGTTLHSRDETQMLKWLWGFQLHQMPMALFENNSNIPLMRNFQSLNASVGAKYHYLMNPFTRTEILMRAQQPLMLQATSNGAELSSQPVFSFDGSIGAEKQFRAGYWLGLFWYGQFQRFKFTYQDPKVTATGTHSVFFSTGEVRLTFDF